MPCRDPETHHFPVCTYLLLEDTGLIHGSWCRVAYSQLDPWLLSVIVYQSHITQNFLPKMKENKIHEITCSFVMDRWSHFYCFEARNPLAFSEVSASFVCTTTPFEFFIILQFFNESNLPYIFLLLRLESMVSSLLCQCSTDEPHLTYNHSFVLIYLCPSLSRGDMLLINLQIVMKVRC